MYIRQPKAGSELGQQYLKEERKCFVVPYGPYLGPLKPYHHGVWIVAKQIVPFSKKKSERMEEGNNSRYTEIFSAALKQMMDDKSVDDYDFKFCGTLDVSGSVSRRGSKGSKHVEIKPKGSQAIHRTNDSSIEELEEHLGVTLQSLCCVAAMAEASGACPSDSKKGISLGCDKEINSFDYSIFPVYSFLRSDWTISACLDQHRPPPLSKLSLHKLRH